MKTTAYRLDHVGIAVASIEEALEIYRALGLRESGPRETVERQGVVTAFLPVGETRLELLQPTGEDSPVARFLAKRGPGVSTPTEMPNASTGFEFTLTAVLRRHDVLLLAACSQLKLLVTSREVLAALRG